MNLIISPIVLLALSIGIANAQTVTVKPDFNREEIRTILNKREILEAAKRFERFEFQRSKIVKRLGFKDGPMCVAPLAISTDSIDHHRSLFVHDLETLTAKDFSLQRTLSQIASQVTSKVPGTTAVSIFRQFWDTQNNTATAVDATNIHCDDNDTKVNGFPLNNCPRPEGGEAQGSNAAIEARMSEYKPTGLINRLDLAHDGWRNCGEHRIIYAKEGGGKNLIIFEAVLPNPKPGCRSGCRDVVEFWVNLSQEADSVERAKKLEEFFYAGLPGFQPVVHVDHYNASGASSIYGGSGSGQIRTNQFLSGGPWTLKEFKTMVSCTGGSCEFDIVPISVKVNPYGELWNRDIATGATSPASPITNIEALATNFQSDVIAQVTLDKLGNPDRNMFTYSVDLNKNAAESQSQNPVIDHYPDQFTLATDATFRTNLDAAASSLGLTGSQIVNRATAHSCAGCHLPSAFGLLAPNSIGPGKSWPDGLGFIHVQSHDEPLSPTQLPESHTSTQGFKLSPALQNLFLDSREVGLITVANEDVCDCVHTRSAFPFTAKRQFNFNRIMNASKIKLGDALLKENEKFSKRKKITKKDIAEHFSKQRQLITQEESVREKAMRKAKIPLPKPPSDIVTVNLNLSGKQFSPKKLKQLKIKTVTKLIEKEPMRKTISGSFRAH